MIFKKLSLVFLCIGVFYANAQELVKGLVFNEYLEPFYKAKIKSYSNSTFSNLDGEFVIKFKDGKLPKSLTISADGFQTENIVLNSLDKRVKVILKEKITLDEIVISASRTPERVIESPVTIERLGLADIRKSASGSFYDALNNLKGIEVRESGYALKSVNARGFADFANTRFIQLVDGMDTAVPALSYNQGNLAGVTDIDLQSVEILPGASSALYGANAYNGLMLVKTKSPFEFTGITALFKGGVSNQKLAGYNSFYDISVRAAYKFSEYFAAKVNFGFIDGEEWHANDYRNKKLDGSGITSGTLKTTIDYDGLNTYGDETPFGGSLEAGNMRRTGYFEEVLLENDYRFNNMKFSAGFFLRPIKGNNFEIELSTRNFKGNNLFQGGTSRYAQRDYYFEQSKIELKNDDFYVRAYYTRNDAGKSYDLVKTGYFLNEKILPGDTFRIMTRDLIQEGYTPLQAKSYVENRYRINPRNFIDSSKNEELIRKLVDYYSFSLSDAIAFEKNYRESALNANFNKELKKIITTPIYQGGAQFYDKSWYGQVEANYNFKKLLNNWADIQVGGSYRNYNPNSKGTIFDDAEDKIKIIDYGIYGQIQKKILNERLKLVGSLRFDKSTNFYGKYSPRFALTFELGEKRNHILRSSFQTAFRNPTVQEQYIYSNNYKTIIGTVDDNLKRFNIETKFDDGVKSIISGEQALKHSLLTKNVYDPKNPQYIQSSYDQIQPESIRTFEFGYRSLLGLTNDSNIDIDFNAFYNEHDNFVFVQDVLVARVGKFYPNDQNQISQAQKEELFKLIDQEQSYWNSQGNIIGFSASEAKKIMINKQGVQTMDLLAYYDLKHYSRLAELGIVTNSKSKVTSYGASLGMRTKFFENFDFGVNYSFMDFNYEDKDYGFEPAFNSPKHSVKVQLGNEKLVNNLGFSIATRWSDKYRWVSQFVKGDIPARVVLDAQLNYKLPSMKSVFKIGGTNLTGNEYQVAPGTGSIGSLYYFSWIINN